VVPVHGDTHFVKIDKPQHSQKEMLEKFTRVEICGSPNARWVKVTLDPDSADVFHVDPVIVPGNWVHARRQRTAAARRPSPPRRPVQGASDATEYRPPGFRQYPWPSPVIIMVPASRRLS